MQWERVQCVGCSPLQQYPVRGRLGSRERLQIAFVASLPADTRSSRLQPRHDARIPAVRGPRRGAAAAPPEHQAFIKRRLGNTRTAHPADRRRGRKCPRLDRHGHRDTLRREAGRRFKRGRSDKKKRSRRAERAGASREEDAVADATGSVRRPIGPNTGGRRGVISGPGHVGCGGPDGLGRPRGHIVDIDVQCRGRRLAGKFRGC